MNRPKVIAIAVFLALACGLAQAVECSLVNGSFEDDGAINNIASKDPNGWTVGVLGSKFKGYVRVDWPTDGHYNLTLYSVSFYQFSFGETATFSQDIDLTDVNEIALDLMLETQTGQDWDPNVCAPVVMIDDNIVWTPDVNSSDISGEYRDVRYAVEDKYRDNQPHTLSLGLIMLVDQMIFEQYYTHWDSITCTFFCNGGGLLPGDLNRDCNVDTLDLGILADAWLSPVDPEDRINLSGVDDQEGFATIDFFDFAIYGDQWAANYADLQLFLEQWLEQIELGDPYNFFTEGDVPPTGVVNFYDFSVVADNWMETSMIPDEPDNQTNE